jgi:hypothetical protein
MLFYYQLRKFLRPVKRFWVKLSIWFAELPYRFIHPALLSPQWLIKTNTFAKNQAAFA